MQFRAEHSLLEPLDGVRGLRPRVGLLIKVGHRADQRRLQRACTTQTTHTTQGGERRHNSERRCISTTSTSDCSPGRTLLELKEVHDEGPDGARVHRVRVLKRTDPEPL